MGKMTSFIIDEINKNIQKEMAKKTLKKYGKGLYESVNFEAKLRKNGASPKKLQAAAKLVKLAEQRVSKGYKQLNEGCDCEEGEGYMLRTQLLSIMDNAKKMYEMVEEEEQFEDWIQSKITLAEDYINTAYSYLMHSRGEESLDSMESAIGEGIEQKNPEEVDESVNDWFLFMRFMNLNQFSLFLDIIKKEYRDTKDLWPIIKKYMKGQTITDDEKQKFKAQMKDALKMLGISGAAALPIPGTMMMIPVILQTAEKLGLHLLPEGLREGKNSDDFGGALDADIDDDEFNEYGDDDYDDDGDLDEADKKWIQKAIKKPGQLHKDLGIPQGQKIPLEKLKAAAKQGGKIGQRARMALNLRKINK